MFFIPQTFIPFDYKAKSFWQFIKFHQVITGKGDSFPNPKAFIIIKIYCIGSQNWGVLIEG